MRARPQLAWLRGTSSVSVAVVPLRASEAVPQVRLWIWPALGADSPREVFLEGAPKIPNDEQTASRHYFALSLAAVAAALVLVAVSAAAPSPDARVPSPTGQFRVGTRTMALTDPARRDPQQAKKPRSVVIQFWYPTAATGPTRGLPVSCSGAFHREKQRSGTSTPSRSEAQRDRERGAIATARWLAGCSLLTGIRRRTRPLRQPYRRPRKPRIRGCRDRPPR